jgi:hypothetical protein
MELDRNGAFIVLGINEVGLKSVTWVIRPDFVSEVKVVIRTQKECKLPCILVLGA